MRQLQIASFCPSAPRLTHYEVRIQEAEWAQEKGDFRSALEWRAIGARIRREGWGDEPTKPFAEPIWFHTQGVARTEVCPCGHFADFLCDEPVGRGRTCDRPACHCCRNNLTEEFDQCDYHVKTKPREPVAQP